MIIIIYHSQGWTMPSDVPGTINYFEEHSKVFAASRELSGREQSHVMWCISFFRHYLSYLEMYGSSLELS